MAPAQDTPASTSPRCPQHQQAAVATCARCGTFLCGECTELYGEAAYCGSCGALVRRGWSSSRALRGAFGLGLLGILCIPLLPGLPVLNFFAAVLGFWLSARELRHLGREALPSPARTLARWVRGLAWANLAILVLTVLAILLLWGLRYAQLTGRLDSSP